MGILREMVSSWLVWLSGLSAGLQSKGSLVRFPVRAHTWVAGQVPGRGHARGNHTLMSLSLSFSLSPLCLKINKILKKIERERERVSKLPSILVVAVVLEIYSASPGGPEPGVRVHSQRRESKPWEVSSWNRSGKCCSLSDPRLPQWPQLPLS